RAPAGRAFPLLCAAAYLTLQEGGALSLIWLRLCRAVSSVSLLFALPAGSALRNDVKQARRLELHHPGGRCQDQRPCAKLAADHGGEGITLPRQHRLVDKDRHHSAVREPIQQREARVRRGAVGDRDALS